MNIDEVKIQNIEQRILEALKTIGSEEPCVNIGKVKLIEGEVFISISFSTKI